MLDRIQGARAPGQLVVKTGAPPPAASFADVLAAQGIKLSAHAKQRLPSLEGQTADRLSSAVQRAENKGSRESLILLDDLAFVVSVKNRTVITAVDGERAKENVFTNIDSVVIG